MGKVRLLLDTHTLLWWAFDSPRLSKRARALLADPANTLLVSAASAWEISTKHRLGRLPEAAVLVQDMLGWFAEVGLTELPITVAHAQRAGGLAGEHKDPFDRMLAAQSLEEDVPVLGNDPLVGALGAALVW